MAIYMGVALGLMIGGLIVIALSDRARYAILITVFFWIGLLLAVLGVLLVLAPLLVYITTHLKAALGV